MSEAYYPGPLFTDRVQWPDYAVECLVKIDQAAAGLVFRHAADDRFYAFMARMEESSGGYHDFPLVEFRKFQPLSDRRVSPQTVYGGPTLAQKEYVLARGVYHRFRIEVAGNRMAAFINEELVLTAQDADDPIMEGGLGFAAADSCFEPGIASFRDLRVTRFVCHNGCLGGGSGVPVVHCAGACGRVVV